MASSDRKSRKMDRKAKFERNRNEGKVAHEKRAGKVGLDAMRPAARRRAEKRAAARAAVLAVAADVAVVTLAPSA